MPFDFSISEVAVSDLAAQKNTSESKARYILRRQKIVEAVNSAETIEDLKDVISHMLEWTL